MVGRSTGVGAGVAARDQGETWRGTGLQDVLDQSSQWCGQRGLPCVGPLAQGDGADTFPTAIQNRDGGRRPRSPSFMRVLALSASLEKRPDTVGEL